MKKMFLALVTLFAGGSLVASDNAVEMGSPSCLCCYSLVAGSHMKKSVKNKTLFVVSIIGSTVGLGAYLYGVISSSLKASKLKKKYCCSKSPEALAAKLAAKPIIIRGVVVGLIGAAVAGFSIWGVAASCP